MNSDNPLPVILLSERSHFFPTSNKRKPNLGEDLSKLPTILPVSPSKHVAPASFLDLATFNISNLQCTSVCVCPFR